MHIEFLVEEPSMQAALENLLPRLLPAQTTFRILAFQGKPDLLSKLSVRLRAYANWIPPDYRIVVLVDEDRQDCRELKRQLEAAARQAGLSTKTSGGARFQVLNRIVIEELEAWFLGDPEALRQAYPGLPASLERRFPDPDAVNGGTWETLARLLQRHGYFQGGYRKLEAASTISAHMNPERNRSNSFRVFRDGLLASIR
jgi:hypothetical protein